MLAVGVWTIACIKTGVEYEGFMRMLFNTMGVFPSIYFVGEFFETNLKDKFKNKE
jgi:hypothetical protein